MKITHVEDYYDKIKERYPHLEMWEIDKILKHGFQSLLTLNSKGADVKIMSNSGFLMYFGKLFHNTKKFMKYRDIKMRIKLRMNYFHNKTVWDGNYYFSLSEEQYKEWIPTKKGRYKSKITFPIIFAYKIKEEAEVCWNNKYLFRLTGEEDRGIYFIERDYSTRNIELIAIRNDKTKKFEDVNGTKGSS